MEREREGWKAATGTKGATHKERQGGGNGRGREADTSADQALSPFSFLSSYYSFSSCSLCLERFDSIRRLPGVDCDGLSCAPLSLKINGQQNTKNKWTFTELVSIFSILSRDPTLSQSHVRRSESSHARGNHFFPLRNTSEKKSGET